MIRNPTESVVPKPKVPDERKMKRRSYAGPDSLEARLDALAARTPLDKSQIVRLCIEHALPGFEKNPGAMMEAPGEDKG